ncbi:MAG TPA: c-type cytochrome domain-containing protein [Bacteroidota bacterium]|nr:c-type cytochrome domain-containing protein [Bacteroidota bacterium]
MRILLVGMMVITVLVLGFGGGRKSQKKAKHEQVRKDSVEVSYQKDIVPILGKYCLPCHTEDEMNPSQLYLDTYENMVQGGKHGTPLVPGKPDSSLLVLKISAHPPFGDPMPYRFKRDFPSDTLSILRNWIQQGARKN